ncbi:MAG: ATP-dependent nuclease [Hydrogenophaga sp.]|uniref:ATP-dependent nuclease n=1 Tax=Hydrogenophaga sp. TaxID=1904254 RepID=UPI004036DD04
MQLLAFNIKNFRSIIESGWTPFSTDGTTVLVGQNESGKSSVLDALHCGFSNVSPTPDDFRTSAPLPSVSFKICISWGEIPDVDEIDEIAISVLKNYLQSRQDKVQFTVRWEQNPGETAVDLKTTWELDDQELELMLKEAYETHEQLALAALLQSNEAQLTADSGEIQQNDVALSSSNEEEEEEGVKQLTSANFAHYFWRAIPSSVPFNEQIGQLPNTVDIDTKGTPTGIGAKAASNFLSIADIDLKELLKDDKRTQENKLNKANAKVSKDFNAFWSQTIGKQGKLELRCEIDRYGPIPADKAGKSHLVFWISDGNTQLYPKQRSQGVRWFVSFYLQLKASEKAKYRRVFLLDEPGANLHSKAQGDVLKLLDKLAKDKSTVIYTTHSPQMIEYPKLYRVHAVQRDGDLDESPTVIIDAHRLGTASTDTLSPILLAMGTDLSNHQVIKKHNNVLIEEMSGYYYLQTFWRLSNPGRRPHFIAATGVNKLELLANMFKGWGLDYIVAVDDDNQGRGVFKNLKREHFGDDDETAKKHLIKLPGGSGIEDIFSTSDFAKFVLNDASINITSSNTEYLKQAGRSKPVIAFHFSLRVEKENLKLNDFSDETKANIEKCVNSINALLCDDPT